MRARTFATDAGFAADLAACRAALRDGSHSFFAASLVLPRAYRAPASALYAFCRSADDAVDRSVDAAAAVEILRARLAAIYAGRPSDDPADRAFAAVVAQGGIPRALPEALLEGFVWDAERRRYADFEALCDYAARVAGTVGAMMAAIMGARAREVFARASELGLAMQLTNIARDVGEDAAMGRLYLPLDWMREAGLDPDEFLAVPRFDARLESVIRRLLAAAEALYARGRTGISALPAGCRPAIRAAAALYAEIGHEVARRGHDSVSGRAVVTPLRKLAVLGRDVFARPAASGPLGAPPHPAIAFLVDAAMTARRPALASRIAWWRIEARAARMIELCEILGERDQLGREGG
jgi:15-cis-phytoene synthase